MWTALTNADAKLVKSLHQKSGRIEQGLFIAESRKLVEEAINSSLDIQFFVATPDILKGGFGDELNKVAEVCICTPVQMNKITTLVEPEGVMAIVKIPRRVLPNDIEGPAFLLEDISDPGNMGTLTRTALWFSHSALYCTAGCVDVYSPKVVRASMGAVFHLPIYIVENVYDFVVSNKCLIATTSGQTIQNMPVSGKEIVILGSESHGISTKILETNVLQVKIPGGAKESKAESLNVAVAGGIFAYFLSGGGI